MRWKIGVLIFISALVIRIPIAFLGEDRLWNDEIDYDRIATNLLKYHQFTEYPGCPYSYRPPGYPFFLAAIYAVFGIGNHMAVRLFQALIGAVAALLLYLLGGEIKGEKAGTIGGLIWAFYPTAVAYTGYLYSETVFMALFLGFLYLMAVGMKMRGRKGILLFAGSGLLYGMAMLTREVLLAFIPLFLVWLIWQVPHRGKAGIIRLIAFMVMVMVVLLPWTARNYSVHGHLILISTNGGCNFYYGNNPETPLQHSWKFSGMNDLKIKSQLFRLAGDDPVLRNKLGYKLALGYILRRPDLFLVRFVGKIMDMWEIDRVPVGRIKNGYYPWMDRFARTGFIGLVGVYYIMTVSLGAIGFMRSSRDRWWWLTLTFLVGFSLILALVYGHTRYRMPLMPFMAVYASMGINRPPKKGELIPLICLLLIWIRQVTLDILIP
ncbi:glycosyltransferase family 39 protein [Candidatus Poribacteria bacterium]|nr:glycosyltransferase family 39 protein [Candidatus Poribacteria bacterium]